MSTKNTSLLESALTAIRDFHADDSVALPVTRAGLCLLKDEIADLIAACDEDLRNAK